MTTNPDERGGGLYMVILEPGRRLTHMRGNKEYEISFRTVERAKEVLKMVRENSGEEYPNAKIVLKSEYWRLSHQQEDPDDRQER